MARAAEIIARFGGQSALARSLGLNQSTVQHWAKTGQIPAWRHDQVLRAARERGVALDPHDLGGMSGAEPELTGPSLGFAGRPQSAARGAAPPAQPIPHGRADWTPDTDGELAPLREEMEHLRQAITELAEEVRALRRERRVSAPDSGRAEPLQAGDK